MARLTQMMAYLNSSSQDWNKSPTKIRHEDFTHFNIDQEAKEFRKWYKYSKEDTFENYLKEKAIKTIC